LAGQDAGLTVVIVWELESWSLKKAQKPPSSFQVLRLSQLVLPLFSIYSLSNFFTGKLVGLEVVSLVEGTTIGGYG
jgi:hypothetical protein